MNKIALVILGMVVAGIATFAYTSQDDPLGGTLTPDNPARVPDHAVYAHMFRQVAAFKEKADEIEGQGGDARYLREHFKREANLNDAEAIALEAVALQADLEIKAIDLRARAVLAAYKAQYPNGRVPHQQSPAPPPPMLRQMTLERNALILSKREELRTAFGEQAFQRFDGFVSSRIAPNISALAN